MENPFKIEELEKNFQVAKANMFKESGSFTIGTYLQSSVECGTIELKDGRIAKVTIMVTELEEDEEY